MRTAPDTRLLRGTGAPGGAAAEMWLNGPVAPGFPFFFLRLMRGRVDLYVVHKYCDPPLPPPHQPGGKFCPFRTSLVTGILKHSRHAGMQTTETYQE